MKVKATSEKPERQGTKREARLVRYHRGVRHSVRVRRSVHPSQHRVMLMYESQMLLVMYFLDHI
jgi:hypothetical protein